MNTISKIRENPGNTFLIFFKAICFSLSFGILALISIYYVQPSTSTLSLYKILDRRTVSANNIPSVYQPQILIKTDEMQETWLPALEYEISSSGIHACIKRIAGHWIKTPRYQTSPRHLCNS